MTCDNEHCLLCGPDMYATCVLCNKGDRPLGRVLINPDRRRRHRVLPVLALIGITALILPLLLSSLSAPVSSTTQQPLTTQALYEATIRDLTLEVKAREADLTGMLRVLEAVALERDEAVAILKERERGQKL